jgi:hypothetical protein
LSVLNGPPYKLNVSIPSTLNQTAKLEKPEFREPGTKNSFKHKKNSQSLSDWLSVIYGIHNFCLLHSAQGTGRRV